MNAAVPFPHVSNSWLVETSFSSLKALNRGGGHLHTICHKKPHHLSLSNCWRSHLAPDVLLSVCLGKPCSVFLLCHVIFPLQKQAVFDQNEKGALQQSMGSLTAYCCCFNEQASLLLSNGRFAYLTSAGNGSRLPKLSNPFNLPPITA